MSREELVVTACYGCPLVVVGGGSRCPSASSTGGPRHATGSSCVWSGTWPRSLVLSCATDRSPIGTLGRRPQGGSLYRGLCLGVGGLAALGSLVCRCWVWLWSWLLVGGPIFFSPGLEMCMWMMYERKGEDCGSGRGQQCKLWVRQLTPVALLG